MICYCENKKAFEISNRKISYMFCINSFGYLQHLYFGKKIEMFDFNSFTNIGYEWGKTYLDENDVEHEYPDGYYNDRSMMEISHHGMHDKRGAQIIIEHADSSNRTSFKYVSHQIYSGKPSLTVMPSFHADEKDCQTLEITLVDEKQNIELISSYTIFENFDVIIRNNRLVNKSQEAFNLIRAYSFQLDLPECNYDLIHFHGDWSLERFFNRKPITNGRYVIESNHGRTGHEENPFAMLAEKNCTEHSGNVYAFALVYTGNFKITTNVDKWYSTRVSVGINDEDFDFVVNPGEEFEFPEGAMLYSTEGFNGISHNMHDLVRDHLIRFEEAKSYRPILFNSWEGCYMDFNTQTILDYIDDAKKIGAELFVLDDGWFGDRDDDHHALGDWYINEEKIDFKKVIDKCHKLGMKFGLWFEPEMINPNSDLYRTHPEYALGGQGCVRSLSRHQLLLDTTNDEAIDTVFEMMCKILDTYEIDYIKVDHNRPITEIASSVRYGETYHRLILGVYKLYNKLIERYPNLFIEHCASGGGRFDLGMLYYSPQIWCSDETNPVQRMFIQYGTSYGYPLSTMGAHISKNPITNYSSKGNVAFFGTYGLEMNPCKLNEEERAQIVEINKKYHKYHNKAIQNGDLYRLLSPFETNYMSMISVSKEKDLAVAFFANLLKEGNRSRYLKLAGLDPNKTYRNDFDNKEYLGSYYMNVGLNFTRWLEEFTTFMIILEEVK